ncbi:carbon-nitrogen hydrolase family protein [Pseudomonas tolaasii]|uniref:Carbon-nitrogen hydrolase family protein n=2 Tax=Pseudomonas tolaasii TaxID=29442 RepID=A0A7Y8ASZ9_PSETO|nr:carbon-nitrogen hydrolase family protein [Pseudomonas tolaasii]ARB28493.1 carbon-nitrogen hydrolase [Pseudomonas tolaasii]KAB0476251.1 carbon-nitrogen hydrolase family protein [Pseudomonas tolaasii]MBW1250985.1 carbon-nitrogen hydrolase family protein [Pseudomonas tolaasii]MBW4791089.1 carbon-nitrogen hydrolase family protein [Pseudomonas tolaasii]MBY8939710.1 carbon-nitrogen hydrolase family protein [Pseudomonas tolaasii]
MKVEFAQLAGRDNDTAYNLERALAAIAACAADTQLIVFPETHLTGFPSAETVAEVAEPLDGPTLQAVIQASRAQDIAVVIGMIESDGGQFYNTTVLITPEGIALRYRKTHLWPLERGVVNPGDRYATCLWKGVRVGLLICYDIEFPETARALGQLGAQLLLVTNGNMDPYGPTHRTAIMARAQENQAFALMVNRVEEGDGDLMFAGGSALVDPFGSLLFEAGREEGQFTVELDLDQLAAARKDYRYLDDQRLKLPGEVVERADGTRELLIPRT